MIEKLKEGIKFFTIVVIIFIGLIICYLVCFLVTKEIVMPIIEKIGA